MGKAKLRGIFQQRLLSTYNKKVNSIGLQAKTLEDIANEAGVPSESIGKGYLIYFINEKKFLADSNIKVDLPVYAKVFVEYEEVISIALELNKIGRVEVYYLFDCSSLQKQYVVQVISFNKS